MLTVAELIEVLETYHPDMRVMFYIPGGYDDEDGLVDIKPEYTVVKPVEPHSHLLWPDQCLTKEVAEGAACETVIVLRDENYAY